MHLNLRYHIPSFIEIGQLVPGKKILICFTVYWHGGHLGHVTIIIFINFHFLVSESLHTKFGKNGPVVSEKNKFSF